MTEPKILVLILAIEKNPWKTIEVEGQDPTWKKSPPNNVRIVRYIGLTKKNFFWISLNMFWRINHNFFRLAANKHSFKLLNFVLRRRGQFDHTISTDRKEITLKVPDIYSLIGAKTIEALAVSYDNFEFDYIYRTNVSSYLDLTKLNEFINDKPRNNYYAGAIGDYQGIRFASGCGYFLSRDVVAKVLEKRSLWDHNFIDDVSLGLLLTRELEIELQPVNRLDIVSTNFDYCQLKKHPKDTFHYRCKAENPRDTIRIMKSLQGVLMPD